MSESEGSQLVASGERLSQFCVVDQTSIINHVTQTVPDPSSTSQNCPVQLVPVHTFVLHAHTKDIRLGRGILVPSFASHWGVVVGTPPRAYTLSHLVLDMDEPQNRQPMKDSTRGKYREVRLHYT